jgi:predicted DsbA family dithiol-disulfide isomerase
MSKPPVILAADFVCPFSYVTEEALRSVAGRGRVVRHLAFELYPAPVPLPVRASEPEWLRSLLPHAEMVGVELRPPGFVPRTRKAHEAAKLAQRQEAETELRDAIYRAYWSESLDIGRIDVLVTLAERCGLDAEALKIGLDIDAVTDEILQDRAVADRAGIRQTPTLIVATRAEPRIAVGAQTLEQLDALLTSVGAGPS